VGCRDVISGDLSQYDEPEWQPLLDLVGLELVDWFMWMHEIELEDSSRVHAYKHTATRRYFHIAEDGRTFLYVGDDGYREIDREDAIAEAFVGFDRLESRKTSTPGPEGRKASRQRGLCE
jgi:hypothetical protein